MPSLTIDYLGQTVQVLDLMRHIMEHEIAQTFSPWFFTYYRDLTGHDYMAKYVRFLRHLTGFHPGGVEGLSVLDAGCGFGIMDVLLALLGAKTVHGIDCHQGMIDTYIAYKEILPYDLPLFPRVADVARMPFEDASFDMVFSHEAISHYPDVDAFYCEAHRVLRPGGTLLISDSNNGLNEQIVQETREIWQAFEQGPPTEDVHGHKVERPFVEQRALIIGEAFPQIAAADVAALARHTSGLWGKEILSAAQDFEETGEFPGRLYQQVAPTDPVQGYVIESLFDPYGMAKQLEDMGFIVQVRPYFGGARGGLLALANNLLAMRPWRRVTMPYAQAFQVLATKVE